MSSRQYFLGIGGDQTGPYLEEDVLNRIRKGAVPPDALVWFEGLPDWQPIQSVEFLREVFSEAGADFTATNIEAPDSPGAPAESGFKPLSNAASDDYARSSKNHGAEIDASSFTSGNMTTVFSESEATFGSGGGGQGKTLKVVGLFALCAVGAIGYLMMEGVSPLPSSEDTSKLHVPVDRLPAQDDRKTRVNKAMSELLLNPEVSVAALQEVIKADPKDAAGKEAIEGLVEYFKNQRNPSEAGRLMMRVGKPLEASQLFLSDPPSYREAEEAMFAAYKISNDANKRDLLVQDVRLLLGQANNTPLAIERIRLLEREFKGSKHPFGYYLTSVDSRIADIFNRTSFYFVQKLLGFIETEFAQMSLGKRPVVEIQKDKRGKYRIVGRYEGPISLQQDKMDNMRIVFWYANDTWIVVETNLTPERAKWASEERERIKENTLTSTEMLAFMEGVFRTQFPKSAIHETVALPQTSSGAKATK